MAKYRKKPVVIEAVQVPLSKMDIEGWNRLFRLIPMHKTVAPSGNMVGYLHIPTLEGTMRANAGDWVIKGVKGEFYPIKDHIFRETYDPVDERRLTMPDKASAAIPEKSLQERLEDAKALAENGGFMSFAGRAEIPLIEELMDLTAQLETAQGLYDDANRDWRAMKVRAEQAGAALATLRSENERLKQPVSDKEWLRHSSCRAEYSARATRHQVDSLIQSRITPPAPGPTSTEEKADGNSE